MENPHRKALVEEINYILENFEGVPFCSFPSYLILMQRCESAKEEF